MRYFARRLVHAMLPASGRFDFFFRAAAIGAGRFFRSDRHESANFRADCSQAALAIRPGSAVADSLRALAARRSARRPRPVICLQQTGRPASRGPRAQYSAPDRNLDACWRGCWRFHLESASAVHRGKWGDRAGGVVTSALLTVPDLVLFLMLLLLAVRTGWFPTGGMVSAKFGDLSVWSKVKDVAQHLFLPALGLALATLPPLVRHIRSAMIEVLEAPFIRAARAHGIAERRVLLRYALPVAANPLISLFGFSMATMLSASLLGGSRPELAGYRPVCWWMPFWRKTFTSVVGAVMLSSVFLVAGNLFADAASFAQPIHGFAWSDELTHRQKLVAALAACWRHSPGPDPVCRLFCSRMISRPRIAITPFAPPTALHFVDAQRNLSHSPIRLRAEDSRPNGGQRCRRTRRNSYPITFVRARRALQNCRTHRIARASLRRRSARREFF